jgi:hypothetical protein
MGMMPREPCLTPSYWFLAVPFPHFPLLLAAHPRWNGHRMVLAAIASQAEEQQQVRLEARWQALEVE